MEKFTTLSFVKWTTKSGKKQSRNLSMEVNFFPNEGTAHYIQSDEAIREISLDWSYDSQVIVAQQKNFYTLFVKRSIDIFVSIFVLLFILSWLAPIIVILQYFDSPGPFYFNQKRTGAQGKPFTCLKFRTMIAKQSDCKFQQTVKNDPRITKLGSFLRKTNIDEMLQFINVLKGEMTIVGPRPHAIMHDSQYWDSPTYRARYQVKPGITGLAQIKGCRGITDKSQLMEHRVRYDHFYISRQSFVLDMRIFFETVRLTFQGDSNAW